VYYARPFALFAMSVVNCMVCLALVLLFSTVSFIFPLSLSRQSIGKENYSTSPKGNHKAEEVNLNTENKS
jgi:hypothetical protein